MRAQSLQCPTLCDPMDCSPPGSSVHGILQAKILKPVAMPSSRPQAWAGEGRRRDARIAAASAAPASPEERRRQLLAFQQRALPLAGGGTRGKVNLSSKSREDAVSRSLLLILSLRLCVEGRSTYFLFSFFRCKYFPVDNALFFFLR